MGLLNNNTHTTNGPTATHGHHGTGTHTHHGAVDGGLVGGVAGHQGHKGHTGRDAVVGAGLGHVAENHHEKHAAGSRAHGVGQPGTTTYTTTTTVPTPSTGDKISGKIDVMVGKMTHDPVKIQEGEIKQTHGKAAVNGGAMGTQRTTRGGAAY